MIQLLGVTHCWCEGDVESQEVADRSSSKATPAAAWTKEVKSGDADLCGNDQSGSCSFADWDTAEYLGIEGSTASEGQEFVHAVERIQDADDGSIKRTKQICWRFAMLVLR
jgi:hypothetical protein